MLKQRVITALILLAVVLAALAAPSPWPFIGLGGLALAAAAWEWARLNGVQGAAALGLAAVMLAVCAASVGMGALHGAPAGALQTGAWLAALAWLAASVALLRMGVPGWPRLPQVLRLALGLAALWAAWLALAQSRLLGVNYLLSAMALVWAADVAAYFAGRALGGRFISRKLAPSISPNKSWEGALGGVAGALLLAVAWVAIDRFWGQPAGWSASLYTRLLGQGGWAWLAAGVVALVALSVAGDLLESLVKRAAGVKDSSQLLPGHGGVLDRVDALLPTLPLALALAGMA
ncbi:MAG: phosphatidate cytidylyltransferase [Comamonadaceae bacterium]|nr:phosphatidate cytidylyltransferase [Comamonadaceae bacterium]